MSDGVRAGCDSTVTGFNLPDPSLLVELTLTLPILDLQSSHTPENNEEQKFYTQLYYKLYQGRITITL